MLYLQRHDIQLRIFPEGRFLHELVSMEQAKEIIKDAVSKSAARTPFALIPGGVVVHIPALVPVVPEPVEGLMVRRKVRGQPPSNRAASIWVRRIDVQPS